MSDWIHDPFSSPESDPEFGLLPKPHLKDFLASYLGLTMKFTSPLKEVHEAGLEQRIGLAQRELCALHVQEQQHLLTEAARIVSHQNLNAEQRQRARAIWSGPLLTMDDWREQCREELVCGRGGRIRTPRILRRMFRRELDSWPSAGDLMRAALNLRDSAHLRIECVRAAFVQNLEEDLEASLKQLWSGAELAPPSRVALLRSLAVLHESAGDAGKAVACWKLVLGREPNHLLAQLSRFSLAVSAADEREARTACRAVEGIVAEGDSGRTALRRALRERAWIARVATSNVTREARDLRIELMAGGELLLSELCLELA